MRFQTSLAVGAGLITLLAAREAGAVECTRADLTATAGQADVPVIYIENGDTQEPLLKRFGKALMQTTGNKIRIIYRNRPTCELGNNFFNSTTGRTLGPVTNASRPIRYIPDDPNFDITSTPPACDIPAAGPTPVQLAIGATSLSSCTAAQLGTQPTDTTVLNGPNQAYGFVVHPNSMQVAILAQEGYLAYGFANDTGQAQPWINQALRLTRGNTASTTLTASANIGLTPTQMLVGSQSVDGGAPVGAANSALIVTAVATETANQQQVIGALGGDLYDSNRDKLKILAFKGFNQRYGYFPDSTNASFDKINVRDGHYLVWSPTQYIFAHGTDPNMPSDPDVLRLVNLLFGETTETDVNGLDSVAKSGLIPQCAMKVSRQFDGGDLSLFSAPEPCGCFFESAVPSGSTACTVCTDDTTCGGGKCRHGYCEAK